MRVKLTEEFIAVAKRDVVAEATGSTRMSYYSGGYEMDLMPLTDEQVAALRDLAKVHAGVKGARAIIRDTEAFLAIRSGTDIKAKTTKQLHAALEAFFRGRPGRHERWVLSVSNDPPRAYYVSGVTHHPRTRDHSEHINVHLAAFAYDVVCAASRTIYGADAKGKTVLAALVSMGLRLFDDEEIASYYATHRHFETMVGRIGLQVEGRGPAESYDSSNWWMRGKVNLDAEDGTPARMVIDVLREDADREDRRSANVDLGLWDRKAGEDEEEYQPPRAEDVLPTHPLLVAFDLRRHQRFTLHAGNVAIYQYDTAMGAKLVLPPEVSDLLRILVTTDTGYRDIVSGKSGGTVILTAGPPGTGKTLSAEVYAESVQRPLYSVQCAQLGTDPVTLEKQLGVVLARADRWNAICLLDEADVYVSRRGESIIQNAVVGVFLRLLERYDGTLFLTTNRGDVVDDAIASRCIARIDYQIPSIAEQRRIWRILADTAEARLSDDEILKISQEHTDLSGRDIKNLLKLAIAVSTASRCSITAEVIGFVRRFKPTGDGRNTPTSTWRPPPPIPGAR